MYWKACVPAGRLEFFELFVTVNLFGGKKLPALLLGAGSTGSVPRAGLSAGKSSKTELLELSRNDKFNAGA
jgi:hypothetical protein